MKEKMQLNGIKVYKSISFKKNVCLGDTLIETPCREITVRH